tara:strand:+ start:2120 stop:3310 length:1191 start_codon:yes stop_codon:yes gene_type:complete
MPSYNLSAFLGGVGIQLFDNNGDPLAGGLIYTYTAGTTTPKATYTTSTGSVANANPIVLDSAGRAPNSVYQEVGTDYKFIVQTSAAVLVGTYDNIPSINDPFSLYSILTNVTGTNTIAATGTPTVTSYATGATYSFIAANTNTAAVTLSIDGLTAKAISKNNGTALSAGDIQVGKLALVEYDGTRFQLLNNLVIGGSVTDATISGGTISGLTTALPVASGGTGRATLTLNNVLLGNGTSAVGLVAPGTSGNLLTSDGTTWASTAIPSQFPSQTGNSGKLLTTNGTAVSWGTDSPIRARASITNGTAATCTVETGAVNVASCTNAGSVYTVTFTTALTSANFQVLVQPVVQTTANLAVSPQNITKTTAGFTVTMRRTTDTAPVTNIDSFDFAVYGGW